MCGPDRILDELPCELPLQGTCCEALALGEDVPERPAMGTTSCSGDDISHVASMGGSRGVVGDRESQVLHSALANWESVLVPLPSQSCEYAMLLDVQYGRPASIFCNTTAQSW